MASRWRVAIFEFAERKCLTGLTCTSRAAWENKRGLFKWRAIFDPKKLTCYKNEYKNITSVIILVRCSLEGYNFVFRPLECHDFWKTFPWVSKNFKMFIQVSKVRHCVPFVVKVFKKFGTQVIDWRVIWYSNDWKKSYGTQVSTIRKLWNSYKWKKKS